MSGLNVFTIYFQVVHEMCSTLHTKKKESFKNVSEKAAELERAKEWELAAEHWLLAGQCAGSRKNQEWSYSRYLFCLRIRKNDGV